MRGREPWTKSGVPRKVMLEIARRVGAVNDITATDCGRASNGFRNQDRFR